MDNLDSLKEALDEKSISDLETLTEAQVFSFNDLYLQGYPQYKIQIYCQHRTNLWIKANCILRKILGINYCALKDYIPTLKTMRVSLLKINKVIRHGYHSDPIMALIKCVQQETFQSEEQISEMFKDLKI